MSIYRVNNNLPKQDQIDDLNEMIEELEGLLEQSKFNENEISQIIEDVGLDRMYIRSQGLGNTISTYTNWSHHKTEVGYAIWKITPSDYSYNSNNNVYLDNKIIVNKGQANSESSTFDYVYLYNGDSGSGYTDDTTEAGTDDGTEFNVMDSSNDYLYMGDSSTFSGAKFEFHTRGSNYTLKIEYYNGSWVELTSNDNNLSDNTSNFTSDGLIEWTTPDDWSTNNVNGQTKYWVRISTTSEPVTTAKIYKLIPGDSVEGLLALSSSEIENEEWKWCTYNNDIYVTIRRIGNTEYEGDYYITSSSSNTNLENYFVHNHSYTADYEDSTYSSSGVPGENIPFDESGWSSDNVHDAIIEASYGGAGSVSSINDLIDVDITGVTNGQVLTYNSSSGNWEAETSTVSADERVGVDSGATAGYLGSSSDDGVLRVGSTLSYSDGGNYVTLGLSHLGLESLSDPNADRIAFWDDSEGAFKWLTPNTLISITGTNLNVDNDLSNYDNSSSGFITDITNENLGDLSNVDLTGIADGKIIKYNSSSSKWEIDDPSDTTYTAGDHLTLDGTEFNVNDDWYDSISDIPTAEPSDGVGNYLSTADQIYDFVVGRGYLTNITNESINNLSDVDFDSGTPVDGYVLKYDSGTNTWKAEEESNSSLELSDLTDISDSTPTLRNVLMGDGSGFASSEILINDLGDVDFDSGTPSDNQVLTYDSSSGKWKAETGGGGISELSDLSDVNTSTPTAGNVLRADGEDWESTTLAISDLTFTAGTNLSLSTNTLNVDDAFLVNDDDDITTGTITAAGFTISDSGYITLDPTPSSDHSATGIISTMTVDANSYGIASALHMDSDGHWIEADANSSTTMPCEALALETGTGSKKVLLRGFIRDDSWDWTVGGLIYVSTTDGELTQTAPSGSGDQVQIVGYATHSDRMYFNPQLTMVEIS